MTETLAERLESLFPRFSFEGSLVFMKRECLTGYKARSGEAKIPTIMLPQGHYTAEQLAALAEFLTNSH